MSKIFFIICIFSSLFVFADNNYRYYIDLTDAKDDKLHIRLVPPDITEQETVFMFPAMVPGTYDVYDFGRFISNLKVTGKNGQQITVKKLDDNSYQINPANQIAEIRYDVEDTWDTDIKDRVVFEPGGSNIEADKVFCLNTHCFFGYFKNKVNHLFILQVTKPKGFYASSGISDIVSGDTVDVLSVENYHHLVDSPIMYCLPDTTTISIGQSQVLISVYSPNKVLTSQFIARNLQELLFAQADYLGGELPIKKYAFLFYFTDKPTLSGASGALEHSYSSFYNLPEADTSLMVQEIRNVAAHEFFHIVI